MKSFIKFVPVIILAFLMAFMKQDALIAAPVATIAAMIVARLTEKLSFQDCVEASLGGADIQDFREEDSV